jgi:hypothetical protein
VDLLDTTTGAIGPETDTAPARGRARTVGRYLLDGLILLGYWSLVSHPFTAGYLATRSAEDTDPGMPLPYPPRRSTLQPAFVTRRRPAYDRP